MSTLDSENDFFTILSTVITIYSGGWLIKLKTKPPQILLLIDSRLYLHFGCLKFKTLNI
jgi:hypothetical protein